MVSVKEFDAMVEMKLCNHAEDRRPWPGPRFDGEWSFDEYRELVTGFVEFRRTAAMVIEPPLLEDLISKLVMHLGRIWTNDSGDVRGSEAYDRALVAGLRIALQRYREHYISSATWRREIAAGSDGNAWLAIAADYEAAGRQLLANAALATATWASPEASAPAARIVSGRDVTLLPTRMRTLPLPGFRAQPYDRRHWLAWDMKNHGQIDVPSMIAYACDENFWVRAALYRSLGFQPTLAVVPVLLEGLLDPQFFARARAAESLGWTAAPSALAPLQHLAREDPSAMVRQLAELAVQRIVGYWTYYGEWKTIAARSERRRVVVHELIARGLEGFACNVVGMEPYVELPWVKEDAVWKQIETLERTKAAGDVPIERLDRDIAAREEEAAIMLSDPGTETDEMLALYAVSKHRTHSERAIDLMLAPGALGWNARRALRALRLPVEITGGPLPFSTNR